MASCPQHSASFMCSPSCGIPFISAHSSSHMMVSSFTEKLRTMGEGSGSQKSLRRWYLHMDSGHPCLEGCISHTSTESHQVCSTCGGLLASHQLWTPSPSHLPVLSSAISPISTFPAWNSQLFSYRMQKKAPSNLHSRS